MEDRPPAKLDARLDRGFWPLAVLLAAALLVRLLFWPGTAYHDGDEYGYVQSGLMLAEGLTPTYKATPGAPVVWLSWAYAMATAAWHLVFPAPAEALAPAYLRPYWALNTALFDAYRDQTTLRTVQLVGTIAASLLATWAAFRLGRRTGGTWGGVLLASVVAFGPLFVGFGLMTRPYVYAWAFGLVAIDLALSATVPRRVAWAFAMLGAAVACRIEMLPLLLPLSWLAWPHVRRPQHLAKLWLLCVGVAYALAPWLVTSLLTNLKSIVGVKLMHAGMETPSPIQTLREIAVYGGLLPLLPLVVVGLLGGAISTGRRAALIAITLLLAVNGFRGSGFGIHQEGALLLTLIALAAVGLNIVRVAPTVVAVGLAASITFLLAALAVDRSRDHASSVGPETAAWVEANVPPGSGLYWSVLCVRQPLPTTESADRLWTDGVDREWREKYQVLSDHGDLPAVADVPRALSLDNMTKEYTQYRAKFILGGRPAVDRPRFDYVYQLGMLLPDDPSAAAAACLARGGAVVLPADDPKARELGPPTHTIETPGSQTAYVWVGRH